MHQQQPQQTMFRGTWTPTISGAPVNFVPYPSQGPPSSSGLAPPTGYAPGPAPSRQPPPPQNTLIGVVCNNFTKLWDNHKMKKKMKTEVSFFRIEPPEGYYRLGDLAENTVGPYPSSSMVVVKESHPGSGMPLLSPPLRYVRMWDDHGTGSKFGDLAVFRPVAPAGYVALGDIAWPNHHSEPPLDYMRCVHTSVCVQGKWRDTNIWNDIGAGAKNGDLAIWAPTPDSDVGGSLINTFVSTSNYQPPKSTERPAWVLIGPRQ